MISTTSERIEWQNASQLMTGDLPGAIAELKAAPGAGIAVYGGVGLAQSMARDDLIDEYRLAVAPVALGDGIPLFPPGAPRRRLSLGDARPLASGTLLTRYLRSRPAPSRG